MSEAALVRRSSADGGDDEMTGNGRGPGVPGTSSGIFSGGVRGVYAWGWCVWDSRARVTMPDLAQRRRARSSRRPEACDRHVTTAQAPGKGERSAMTRLVRWAAMGRRLSTWKRVIERLGDRVAAECRLPTVAPLATGRVVLAAQRGSGVESSGMATKQEPRDPGPRGI
jgi:hypothetical protein